MKTAFDALVEEVMKANAHKSDEAKQRILHAVSKAYLRFREEGYGDLAAAKAARDAVAKYAALSRARVIEDGQHR